MSVLPGNQRPEPGRKELLRFFGVTETELREYRKLPVDEAKWRIEHEHKVQVAWAERRRAFLLTELTDESDESDKPGLDLSVSHAPTHGHAPHVHTRSTL